MIHHKFKQGLVLGILSSSLFWIQGLVVLLKIVCGSVITQWLELSWLVVFTPTLVVLAYFIVGLVWAVAYWWGR